MIRFKLKALAKKPFLITLGPWVLSDYVYELELHRGRLAPYPFNFYGPIPPPNRGLNSEVR